MLWENLVCFPHEIRSLTKTENYLLMLLILLSSHKHRHTKYRMENVVLHKLSNKQIFPIHSQAAEHIFFSLFACFSWKMHRTHGRELSTRMCLTPSFLCFYYVEEFSSGVFHFHEWTFMYNNNVNVLFSDLLLIHDIII